MDDDPGVLKALGRLLHAHGFRAQSFGSGREFLAALPHGLPVCLIVDFLMPEMTGLKVQQYLVSTGIKIPTILITAHGDAVALGFGEGNLVASFRKPVQEGPLLSAIERAIDGPRGTLNSAQREPWDQASRWKSEHPCRNLGGGPRPLSPRWKPRALRRSK